MAEADEDYGLVFCRQDGRPLDPDSVTHTFERLARAAGLPVIRFHDLQHTLATLSLKAGIPTEVVSRILGHRNPATTQVFYQHESRAGRSRRSLGLPPSWTELTSCSREPPVSDRYHKRDGAPGASDRPLRLPAVFVRRGDRI